MRFRIIREKGLNYVLYTPQYRRWLRWKPFPNYTKGLYHSINFHSIEECLEFIDKQCGNRSEIVIYEGKKRVAECW